MVIIPDVGKHQYNIETQGYPISSNDVYSTYDQFIQLRDTLQYSGKQYSGKGGCKLIIGEKEETVEIQRKNRFKLSFEPGYEEAPEQKMTLQHEGPYVVWLAQSTEEADKALATTYGVRAVRINKDGHYLMLHKQEILLSSSVKKVYCYLDYFAVNDDGSYPATGIPIAVFDWQGEFSKTFTGTTSGTDPNGTCSINVKFTLGDIIQKMTSFGYNERNLKKNDILVLKCVDQDGNELTYQEYSNFLQVNYTDLTLKE